jgi:hypothetical protein
MTLLHQCVEGWVSISRSSLLSMDDGIAAVLKQRLRVDLMLCICATAETL